MNPNIRYLLLDMTHVKYTDALLHLTALHENKEAGNKLTVLPNINKTQAIVKVSAHEGWVEEETPRLTATETQDLFLAIYDQSQLREVNQLIGSSEWPQEEK